MCQPGMLYPVKLKGCRPDFLIIAGGRDSTRDAARKGSASENDAALHAGRRFTLSSSISGFRIRRLLRLGARSWYGVSAVKPWRDL